MRSNSSSSRNSSKQNPGGSNDMEPNIDRNKIYADSNRQGSSQGSQTGGSQREGQGSQSGGSQSGGQGSQSGGQGSQKGGGSKEGRQGSQQGS